MPCFHVSQESDSTSLHFYPVALDSGLLGFRPLCVTKEEKNKASVIEELRNWEITFEAFLLFFLPSTSNSLNSFIMLVRAILQQTFCLKTIPTVFSCCSNGWPRRALLLRLAIYVQKGFFNTIKRAAKKKSMWHRRVDAVIQLARKGRKADKSEDIESLTLCSLCCTRNMSLYPNTALHHIVTSTLSALESSVKNDVKSHYVLWWLHKNNIASVSMFIVESMIQQFVTRYYQWWRRFVSLSHASREMG